LFNSMLNQDKSETQERIPYLTVTFKTMLLSLSLKAFFITLMLESKWTMKPSMFQLETVLMLV
jgi:hypothetical protein